MAVILKNKVLKNVGTVPQTLISTGETEKITVIGLSLANITSDFVYADIMLRDDTSVTGFYLKNTIVAGNSCLRAVNQGEKLVVASNNELLVASSTDDSLDVICSYAEIV